MLHLLPFLLSMTFFKNSGCGTQGHRERKALSQGHRENKSPQITAHDCSMAIKTNKDLPGTAEVLSPDSDP